MCALFALPSMSVAYAGDAGCVKAARGAARLTDVAALPVYDPGARVGYVGSIDPFGFNVDWNWGEVQDENGEWLLFEDDKPGCIYNFTQHRGEAERDPVPTYRFYFDGAKTPQFEIKPKEFGSKPPFLEPVAGAFKPNFPFRIVRSFVPMEYRKSVRVTSTVKLEGYPQAGGWGHVMFHSYDSSDGLATFDGKSDGKDLAALYSKPLSIPHDGENRTAAVELAPGASADLFSADHATTLVETALEIRNLDIPMCTNVWLVYSFDGKKTVEAPIGTFFGCEMPYHNVKRALALLTFDTSDASLARLSNRFPMPFFKSASVKLENRGAAAVSVASAVVRTNSKLRYDPKTTGYFSSTVYLGKKKNWERNNARIGRFVGKGQMVYGVISGYDFTSEGCEGDVRCFIDDMTVPRIQSDGSESWGSWGWGFGYGPQMHPFSTYDSPERSCPSTTTSWEPPTWCETRLCIGDAAGFRRFLRFDLEHGRGNNHPESSSSGQCFGYLLGN